MALAFALVLAITYQVMHRQVSKAMVLITYLSVLQPALRLHVPQLPYLFQEYLFLFWGVLLLAGRQEQRRISAPVFWYGAYFIVSLLNLLRADSLVFGRTIFIPSGTLLLFLVLSTRLVIDRAGFVRIYMAYLVGAFSLAALILQTYFSGQVIAWSTKSNYAASGAMGPNQISIVFAAAIFIALLLGNWSVKQSGGRWLAWFFRIVAMVLTFLLILTFSRGGISFWQVQWWGTMCYCDAQTQDRSQHCWHLALCWQGSFI